MKGTDMREIDQPGVMERAMEKAWETLRTCRVPIASALAAGILTHGFAFTNKLLNADEIGALFGKGQDLLGTLILIGPTLSCCRVVLVVKAEGSLIQEHP